MQLSFEKLSKNVNKPLAAGAGGPFYTALETKIIYEYHEKYNKSPLLISSLFY